MFTVNWLVLSKDDGHLTRGSYVFTISQNQQQQTSAPLSSIANQSAGFTETASIEDTQIKIDASLLKVGENTFKITVTNSSGNPIENIRNVFMEINNPSKGLGPLSASLESKSPGNYSTTGSFLSQTGEWEVEVTVQRTDAYDLSRVFEINVG